MEMVRLTSLTEYYNLPINKWNIKQPPDFKAIESVFDNGKIIFLQFLNHLSYIRIVLEKQVNKLMYANILFQGNWTWSLFLGWDSLKMEKGWEEEKAIMTNF